jgi:hypothetical protein
MMTMSLPCCWRNQTNSVFLPANTTSVVQPLDQGIITALKAHCRRRLVRWLLQELNKCMAAGDSLYQMMRWVESRAANYSLQPFTASLQRAKGLCNYL